MAGFSSVTGDESIMFADNCSFDGTKRGGKMTTNGQLWVGSTASPHVKLGNITSPNSSIIIGYSSPNITLQTSGNLALTYTENIGTAQPISSNLNVVGTATNGIQTTGSGDTVTVSMHSPFADSNFSFESQVGGTTRTLTVQNTVNAASSAAEMNIQVAGTSSDNPYLSWRVAGQRLYQMNIENSVNTFFFARSNTGNSTTIAESVFRVDGADGSARFWMQAAGGSVVGGTAAFSGANATSLIINNNAAAASNAELKLQVLAEGSGGNAYTSYVGPANNWYHGVNKTGASNAWQLQQNTVSTFPSATVVMSVTPAGDVTFPLTPAFLAFPSGNTINATGDSTAFTCIFDTEIFDQGSNFASNTFTAPVTGRYILSCGTDMSNLGAGHTQGDSLIITSNRNYVIWELSPAAVKDSIGVLVLNGSTLADMDAADTATIQLTVANSTKTVTYLSSSYFSGSLQC